MSRLVAFGTVSTETKGTFCQGKFVDGAKALSCGIGGSGIWIYKTSDTDITQPLRPAPVG